MKPVSAQCKFDTESTWSPCSVEHHNLVQSQPEKWPQYNTRLLYTREAIDEMLNDILSICESKGDEGLDGHYCADEIARKYK